MPTSSTNHASVGKLPVRLGLTLFVFVLANVVYPSVFETVGYMYNVNLGLSYLNIAIASLLLVFLILASNFKNTIIRHGFDIAILGVFLPVAVISCQINSAVKFMLYPFFSISVMILSVRIFEGLPLIKSMNSPRWGAISFTQLRTVALIVYSIFLVSYFGSNILKMNLNIIDTYITAYDIRAEQKGDGLLGYFLGCFIIVFFPLFLCKNQSRFRILAPLLVFVGTLYVFQTFAIKAVLLNFLLISMFAYAFQKKFFTYLPQLFFATLFISPILAGPLINPLLDRFFYLVGLNTIFYLDFFSINPLRYFEGGKLDLGISNYGLDPGYIIDNAYYQGLGTNQSAGFLPTIFSDVGILGILVSSVLIGALISLIKSMQASSENYAYLVMVAFMFSLMNHPITMLFLSNGLILIVVFALILKRQGRKLAVIQTK